MQPCSRTCARVATTISTATSSFTTTTTTTIKPHMLHTEAHGLESIGVAGQAGRRGSTDKRENIPLFQLSAIGGATSRATEGEGEAAKPVGNTDTREHVLLPAIGGAIRRTTRRDTEDAHPQRKTHKRKIARVALQAPSWSQDHAAPARAGEMWVSFDMRGSLLTCRWLLSTFLTR